jgi:hypothetical protein
LEILQYFFAIQELIHFEKLVPASGHFAEQSVGFEVLLEYKQHILFEGLEIGVMGLVFVVVEEFDHFELHSHK